MTIPMTIDMTIPVNVVTPQLQWDTSYAKTISGYLKITEIGVGFIVFICVLTTPWSGTGSGPWTEFVSVNGLWFTGFLLIGHMLHLFDKYPTLCICFLPVGHWMETEFVFCALWTFFYAICSIAMIAAYANYVADIVAAIFSIVATGIYGYDAFLRFKARRAVQSDALGTGGQAGMVISGGPDGNILAGGGTIMPGRPAQGPPPPYRY